ncbi:MAG: hypothetical protein WA373_10130 [Burkholderiales bacterium]
MALFKIPKKSKEEKLAKISPSLRAELDRIEADAIANFEGQVDEMESALGMLRLGHHVGWKVLYLIHSKATIRKYEAILGIKVRELFPEEGPSSYRFNVYRLAETASNFWKVVSGAVKLPDHGDRREVKR